SRADRAVVEDGGDETDTVKRDALVDQMASQARGPKGAVTFARDEQGRYPALVVLNVQADELAYRLNVALDAVVFAGDFLGLGPAVTRAHGVDEHQVGLIEPGGLVVDELKRRRRHVAVVEQS